MDDPEKDPPRIDEPEEGTDTPVGDETPDNHASRDTLRADLPSTTLTWPDASRRAPRGYRQIRDALAKLHPGHSAVRDRLALLASPSFREYGPRQRVLIAGASHAGKSHLAYSLGLAAGMPVIEEDASALAEPGYEGRQVGDVARRAWEACGRDIARLEEIGVILVLDGIDHATVRRRDSSGDDVDPRGSSIRAARQAGMLQLLAGTTPIPFTVAPGVHLICRTDRWMILLLGTFAGTSWVVSGERVSSDHLITWGMTTAFAAQITQRWVLGPRSVDEIRRILSRSQDGVSGLAAAAASQGLSLYVAPETVGLLATQIVQGLFTLSSAVGHLTDLVLDRMVMLLNDDTVQDRAIRIRPDDLVRQPQRAAEGWRPREQW